MQPQVHLQTPKGGENFITYVARVGFVFTVQLFVFFLNRRFRTCSLWSEMELQVLLQRARSGERLKAVRAGVGADARVRPQMHVQVAFGVKPLAAIRTLVPLVTVRPNVVVQMGLQQKHLTTDVAKVVPCTRPL